MDLKPQSDCVFCKRIEKRQYLDEYLGVVWFEPLNPVTPGHLLFVPKRHANPKTTLFGMGAAMLAIDEFVSEREVFSPEQANIPDFNAGRDASQTIEHLHVHYVPRRLNDGRILPWTNQ